jgi:hypothetical protein
MTKPTKVVDSTWWQNSGRGKVPDWLKNGDSQRRFDFA